AIVAFIALVVIGLYWVKWHPYYHKGFATATKHSLGASIVSGHSATAPSGWSAALDFAYKYTLSIWPALTVGLLLGAGIQELLPRDWLRRVLGQSRWQSTAIAGVAAVPSMMCTCCSAPPAVGLARARASIGATIAYWVGNPVLNPATMVFMGLVLGWRWVGLRILVGLPLVFGAAAAVEHLFGRKVAVTDDVGTVVEETTPAAGATSGATIFARWLRAAARLAITLIPEYAIVVLALGAVRAFLFPTMSHSIGGAAWLVVLLAITGTLFVIPTAGEIPIIAVLLGFGLSAAGAGALMITLPAVSLPSLVMVGRAVPARVLVFVGGSVVVAGLVTAGLAAAFGL
ncbi:MAG: permease, partial [Acidimicrobiales bacterium]|nr:permease [Acidimicrobiales bacterium]